jgi:hypothetical protein
MAPPVVFLIFNRRDLTEKVFDRIRQAKPTSLLVVADGPRRDRPDDEAKCRATREVVEKVDWPCQVLKNYSDVNLGCRQRIASGIIWAFQQVEEAIVLEDDCLPHASFFDYCAELLNHYRHDTRVMSISGDNYQQGQVRGPGSYYFSKYGTCWGWATWRRAWSHFDLSMSVWPAFRDSGALRHVCPDPVEHDYWHEIFEAMYAGKIDSWAYAWLFAGFVQNGLSPHPNQNLVSNIGFGPEATHTMSTSPVANLPSFDIGTIRHPPFMVADRDADRLEFDTTHGGATLRRNRTVRGKIRGFLGHIKSRTIRPLKKLLRA